MDAVILGVTGLLAADSSQTPPSSARESTVVLRSALRDLAAHTPVVLLDTGPADDLEAWSHHTGAADLAAFRLWTGRLGGQAKPPSRLPFRFVARRLEIMLSNSLYVGCDDGLLEAARRCGCPTWDVRHKPNESVPDDVVGVVEWLQESFGGHARS